MREGPAEGSNCSEKTGFINLVPEDSSAGQILKKEEEMEIEIYKSGEGWAFDIPEPDLARVWEPTREGIQTQLDALLARASRYDEMMAGVLTRYIFVANVRQNYETFGLVQFVMELPDEIEFLDIYAGTTHIVFRDKNGLLRPFTKWGKTLAVSGVPFRDCHLQVGDDARNLLTKVVDLHEDE